MGVLSGGIVAVTGTASVIEPVRERGLGILGTADAIVLSGAGSLKRLEPVKHDFVQRIS